MAVSARGLAVALLGWCLVASPSVPAAASGRPQSGLPEADIRVGERSLRVEVARTPRQRRLGLMHRSELPAGRGMLFVFEREQPLSFWMKNTLIPLDIAYIAADGRIVDIQQMMPLSLQGHPSAAPARFALEVQQGWFEAQGIAVGDRVAIPILLTRP